MSGSLKNILIFAALYGVSLFEGPENNNFILRCIKHIFYVYSYPALFF
jgi:hypothetical protein